STKPDNLWLQRFRAAHSQPACNGRGQCSAQQREPGGGQRLADCCCTSRGGGNRCGCQSDCLAAPVLAYPCQCTRLLCWSKFHYACCGRASKSDIDLLVT